MDGQNITQNTGRKINHEAENGQDETMRKIIQTLLKPNVEVILVKEDVVMTQINIQSDIYSDYLYVLMEYRLGHLYILSVGLSFRDTIRNALWRAAKVGDPQVGDIEKIKRIKAFEEAFSLGGEDNE